MKDIDLDLMFLFINDLSNTINEIKPEILRVKKEFINKYGDLLDKDIDKNMFEKFNSFIFTVHKKLKPKISLIGFLGVGKTTITELIRTQEFPIKQEPMKNKDISIIKIGNLYLELWDFSSREQFEFLWSEFIKGSDAIIIVTDSTMENVEKSKTFLKIINESAPNANTAVIANKRDRTDAIEPIQIANSLGLQTYSTIASDPSNREIILQIIIDVLHMSSEISYQLQLLNQRYKLRTELVDLIKEKRFDIASSMIDSIVELCVELGDEALRKEYVEMGQTLSKILKKETNQQGDLLSQELDTPKISLKERLFKTLTKNYMNDVDGIIAITICDRDGFIISSESKEESESEVVIGAMATIVDGFMDRIKGEFGEGEGSCFNSSITGDKKFTYCSMGPNSILTTLSELTTSDTELRIYSEHIAKKVELILQGNDAISPEIPQVIKAISKTKGGKLPEGLFTTKIIMTGNYQVGKSSTLKRFVQNFFAEGYQATIGVDISQRFIELNEQTRVKFIIWDIGGQITQMAPYRTRFYEGANAALIVIDRTRPDNLKSVDLWYNDIKKYVPEDIPIIIVGNKSDLVDKIVISEEEIKQAAEQRGFHYILTSAKTGENVDSTFMYIAYKFLETL